MTELDAMSSDRSGLRRPRWTSGVLPIRRAVVPPAEAASASDSLPKRPATYIERPLIAVLQATMTGDHETGLESHSIVRPFSRCLEHPAAFLSHVGLPGHAQCLNEVTVGLE